MVGLRLLAIIISLVASFSASAVVKTVEGDGRFYASDDDSLSFVKTQLIHSAIKDIYTKEIKQMGLDSDLFWSKFDERFDVYFTSVEENLKEKYGLNKENPTKLQKENYEKGLRQKRLVLKAKFGRLDRAIRSYSEKRVTRSTQSPNSRFLKIQAKVDRTLINRLYYEFTTEGKLREFTTLYVSANFNLMNCSWNDVGVELSSDFTDVVLEHWKGWLEKTYKGKFKEVIVADEGMIQTLGDYIKVPLAAKMGMQMEGENDPGQLNDSAWINVTINIQKELEDPIMSQRVFRIDGNYLLTDMRDNRVLSHYDFPPSVQKHTFSNAKQMSSNLASFVYSLPQPELKASTKRLSSLQVHTGILELTVQNVRSFENMLLLSDILTTKGAAYGFSPKIYSFDGKEGLIQISFRGNRRDVGQILKQLENRNVEGKGKITFSDPENPFNMVWVGLQGESNGEG